MLFGVGGTVGAGVFSLLGIVAKYSGASIFLSFLISGLIAMISALVYAELGGRMPSAGSGYTYIYSILGELPAWITAWNMNLLYGISASALARSWSSYFMGLLS